MTTFANAVRNQSARTQNNMKARASTANPCVDLFFKIGASRGKDILPDFIAAYQQNRDWAMRIALWARDVRGGAGERQLFRNILLCLEKMDTDAAIRLVQKAPEVGRWDDILVLQDETVSAKNVAFNLIQKALLEDQNGLCAKWMPRKGELAVQLRNFLGLTPKQYRKLLVRLTKVVETQMCAKQWDEINFSHVPSLAASRYKKAFARHTPKYAEYVALLQKPEVAKAAGVKINAAAVYPYDVLKGVIPKNAHFSYNRAPLFSAVELGAVKAQWDALPNYIGDANILPLVDVSGSMTDRVNKKDAKADLTYLDIAVSLGLYCADKNQGKFKDTFLTFSSEPQLLNLQGDILQKIGQMVTSKWEMSTDLHKALIKILAVAKDNDVPESEMPGMLLILSDMQFDQCVRHDDSAIEMISRKYAQAGYTMPKVVFWNLNAYDNAPVRYDASGTALVSGFSPSIVRSILAANPEKFTPESIMLETIMKPRYDV